MKKAYVRPIMESEAFVANEYVAACWTVTCDDCGAYQEGYDQLKNSVNTASTIVSTQSIYEGKLGGKDPCQTYDIPKERPGFGEGLLLWILFVDILGYDPGSQGTLSYHEVGVTEGWTVTNHPNASV